MTLNASGPISLGGSTSGQSINLELGQSATAQVSMNDTNVRTLAAVPSGAIIMPTNFYGKSNFTLAFNNADDINIFVGTSGGGPLQASYGINTNATCTKGGTFTPSPNNGPTAWGSPTGGTPGNSYEVRLNVTEVFPSEWPGNYVQFAGVNVTGTGFTSWYALSSNRFIEVYVAGQFASITGTLYIRNTSTLVEISRAFYVGADLTV